MSARSQTNRNRVDRMLTGKHQHGPKLPIEPLREFIRYLLDYEKKVSPLVPSGVEGTSLGPGARVAYRLGVTERQVQAWMKERATVPESAADAALSHEGSRHLGDLWPELYWPDADESDGEDDGELF
jgi:hypothetical protein